MSVIGFLGAGNMGKAIIKGLEADRELSILAFDPDRAKIEELKTVANFKDEAKDPLHLARFSEYIVLAVKPQIVEQAIEQILPELGPEKCIISIAAGTTMEKIRKVSGKKCPVVRVMPNTPALVGAGVFALCLEDKHLPAGKAAFIREMFNRLGRVYEMEEKLFDAFTAVAGSGPAYVYYFMEAIIEAAVTVGMRRDLAEKIVLDLFAGSTLMAQKAGEKESLGRLRELVTSPGGSTVRALNHFDRKAVRGSIIDGVTAACERNRELG